jgi:iron complex transport system permease protein
MTPERLRARAGFVLLILGLLLVAGVLLSLCIGPWRTSPADVLQVLLAHLKGGAAHDPVVDQIVWESRLPRTLLALLAGGALAVAGVVMQSLFHNPMADPYIVGVSSGAALGAQVAITLGIPALVPWLDPTAFWAFLGAVAVTMIVYGLARRVGRIPITTLLLTGIAIGSLLQAVTAFLLLMDRNAQQREALSWLMGSFAIGQWKHIGLLLPYVVVGVTLAFLWQRDLNVLALGDETAHHLGVHVARTKTWLLFIASLLAAGAVAVSGVIAFVGLIVPHLMRLLVGPNHRVLLLASLLGGGVLLVVSDVLARSVLGSEIPIGIVTSLIGVPFFLSLLHHREKRSG